MKVEIERLVFKEIAKRLEDDNSDFAETIKFRATRLRESISSTVPVSLAGASLRVLKIINEIGRNLINVLNYRKPHFRIFIMQHFPD